MTTRGVKYHFSVGEHVLCFEPDPTKARVLYDAKVLDLCPGKDHSGRRKPEYHIHFQGWNSSWDRIVGESFILKNSEDNKFLMKKLAETARRYTKHYGHKNRVRKQKINAILRRAFAKKPRFDSESESSSSSGSSSGSDDGSGEEEGMEEEEEEEDDINESDPQQNGTSEHEEQSGSDDREEQTDSDDGEVSLKGGKYAHVDIPIPKLLKDKLEQDYYNINNDDKLVKLPAEPNVLSILESYVKNFVVNILCSNAEKLRPGLRDFARPEPDKSVPLCKEVVNGLRVCFDFTLPLLLLYAGEKNQHDHSLAHYKPPTPNGPPAIRKEVESLSRDFPKSPVLPSSRLRSSSRLQSSSTSGGEPSPKIPKLSPKISRGEEVEEHPLKDAPHRRLTRQSITEVGRQSRDLDTSHLLSPRHSHSHQSHGHIKKSRSKSERGNAMTSSEPKVTRSTRRHSGTLVAPLSDPERDARDLDLCANSVDESNHNGHAEAPGLSRRVTPPPPLLIPSAISSRGSSAKLTPTGQTAGAASSHDPPASDKETALNDVFSWRLVPLEMLEQRPPLPSVVYGAHHLLRLFVKLPELVRRMKMSEHKQKALLKHFELFLEYLANREDEFFLDSAYVDASDYSK